jgi:hypothetical protein
MFLCSWNSIHDLRKKQQINKSHRKETANQQNPMLLVPSPYGYTSSTPLILSCLLPLLRQHPINPLLLLLSHLDKFSYLPLAPKSTTVCWSFSILVTLVVLLLNLGAIVGFGQCNSLVRPKYLLF